MPKTLRVCQLDPLMPERFLLGELNHAELEFFEAHFWKCEECFAQVKAGMAFINGVNASHAELPHKPIIVPAALCLLAIIFASVLVMYPKQIAAAVPFIIFGGAVMAMLCSVLFRYSERFREFWSSHVCGWMEEHVNETKGGR